MALFWDETAEQLQEFKMLNQVEDAAGAGAGEGMDFFLCLSWQLLLSALQDRVCKVNKSRGVSSKSST